MSAFVLGNSWQLNWLSFAQIARLNQEPNVVCLNQYPEHWKDIGIKPTAWVFGDVYREPQVHMIRRNLEVIFRSVELLERLRYIFVGKAKQTSNVEKIYIEDYAKDGMHWGITFLPYDRYKPMERPQQIARNMSDKIIHWASTFTDAINLAWIISKYSEVKLLGSQRRTSRKHFYNWNKVDIPLYYHTGVLQPFEGMVDQMWRGMMEMHRQGIPIIDCNFEHGNEGDVSEIPREKLWDAV